MSLRDLIISEPVLEDGAAMWRIAQDVGLDPNSPYKYLLFCRDFAQTSAVARTARDDADLAGFVTGYLRPASPRTLFVWQIGVGAAHRGQGVAGAMLDHLAGAGAVDSLEATVTPGNDASLRTFSSFAKRHHARLETSLLFGGDLFPQPHDDEMLLRIGPF